MAKGPETPFNITETGFNLDLEEKKRQADLQNAQFIAQMMYQRMKTEMEMLGYMVKPDRDGAGVWTGEFVPMQDDRGQRIPTVDAANQAREIALREAEFEFTKLDATRRFGIDEAQLAIQKARLALDQQNQQAALTGFYSSVTPGQFTASNNYQPMPANLDGNAMVTVPTGEVMTRAQAYARGWTEVGAPTATLDRQRFEADKALREASLSGYLNGQNTLEREQFLANATGYVGGVPGAGGAGGTGGAGGGTETLERQIQMGQLTGYVGGAPTLQRETQIAGLTGYLNGQSTLDRERLLEQQRQNILNAPRGPADFPAYLNRLRGMNQNGWLPGILDDYVNGRPIAAQSNAGQETPMPLTNTGLALGLLGAGSSSQPTQPTQPTQPRQGASPPLQGIDPPQAIPGRPNTTYATSQSASPSSSSSASPYGSPYDAGIERMFAPVASSQEAPQIPSSRSWSPTEWTKMSPTEQKYLLGYNAEFNAEPIEDAEWNLKQSGANFRQAKRAQILGVG